MESSSGESSQAADKCTPLTSLNNSSYSCGSAPFELVKVQRQLEYLIAVQNGLLKTDKSGAANHQQFVGGRYKAQNGFQAAAAIWRNHGGMKGFYIGFPLHLMRDTLGTSESMSVRPQRTRQS